MFKTARQIGWTAIAGVLAFASVAQANPYAEQMEAVVRIGSEQIDLRLERGVELVSEARAEAISILQVAEALGVDDETLELAEFDAYTAVREAAKMAHDDMRGMAVNTVTTLENFGATQEQIATILDLWELNAEKLDDAIDLALEDVDATTPAYTDAVRAGLVPVDPFASDLAHEATVILDAMALEMEAQIRAETDAVVRTIRYEMTRSLTPRDERKMYRSAKKECKVMCKTSLETLKQQYKAYRSALKQRGASRDEQRALRDAFKEARQVVKWAMEDAQEDLKAAR
ncbi:MAG: hypothetical protein Tsb0013_12410 [Phycisphaerales bacterium]